MLFRQIVARIVRPAPPSAERLPVTLRLGAILILSVLSQNLTRSPSDAASPLVVEETPLTVEIRGQAYVLAALIVKPSGVTGRLPVALVAHGSPRDNALRASYRAAAMLPRARDLAHRGWLTVAFLRRGFGESQGPFAEGFTCTAPDFRRALAIAAEDIEAVRVAVSRRPDADVTRVLGLGVSVGGAAMLAWAAGRPDGLIGVVNLSGGTGSLVPGQNCDEDGLVSAFGSYGARTRVPTLWVYAENDSFFGLALVRRMHTAFTQGGGDAQLNLLGPVGEDGHTMWNRFDGLLLWLPALDRFLRAHGAPTWDPGPIESAARGLTPAARRVLETYLSAPTEKALSISRTKGLARFWSAVPDLATARQKSREQCEQESGERCDVLFENFAPAASTH
jgi:pimeloyl-ACP methyl ester carboxylesterase